MSYSPEYYKAHKKEYAIWHKRWAAKNPEKLREYTRLFMREYRLKHPERIKRAARKYYYTHQAELQRLGRKRYRDNLPHSRNYMRKHQRRYIRTLKGNLVYRWQMFTARVKGQIKDYINCAGLKVINKSKFIRVASENKHFKNLWKAYVRSRFNGNYAPSFYRIDTDKGYVEKNLVILAKGNWNKNAVLAEARKGRII